MNYISLAKHRHYTHNPTLVHNTRLPARPRVSRTLLLFLGLGGLWSIR
jgi:hypothetical protein